MIFYENKLKLNFSDHFDMCNMFNHEDSKKFYSNASIFEKEKITSNGLIQMINQMTSGSSTCDSSKPPRTKLKKRQSFPESKRNIDANIELNKHSPLQCDTDEQHINKVNEMLSNASISSGSSSSKEKKSDENYSPKNQQKTEIDWCSYKRKERAKHDQNLLETQFQHILKSLDESGNLQMSLLENNLLQIDKIRKVYNRCNI